jgi:hypothetical protein
MRTKISWLLVASFVLMATGSSVLWLFHKPARDEIVGFVPADAVAYAHLYLRPSTQQQLALRDLLERLPVDLEDADELKEALGRLLDPVLRVSGMTYRRDVSGWLGDQMGSFALPGSTGQAVLLSIASGERDQAVAAARKALQGRAGISFEVVEDLLVIGSEAAVTVASGPVSGRRSLADDKGFQGALEPLPDDRILTVFARQDGSVIAASGTARDAGVDLDISAPDMRIDEITPGSILQLLGRLDEADILPVDRFGGLLQALDEAAPQVITALRLSGVMADGDESFDEILGDGYSSSLVFDVERIESLSGFLPSLGTGPDDLLELARYISHIVLGTRTDKTIRIFIGVK